jgi:hypothetical protein
MKNRFYLIILLFTFFCLKGFTQASAPSVNGYADTVGSGSALVYIYYTANDTGIISAQIQLQQGIGNTVYDSTYSFRAPASDSGYILWNIDSLTSCTTYQVLINMANDDAQGLVINPLLSFTTLCTTGIVTLNENGYSIIAFAQNIEVKSTEIPQNESIQIYDLTGRLILNTSFNQSVQQIPFNQNAGLYLLRITGNGQSLYTNRFVVY